MKRFTYSRTHITGFSLLITLLACGTPITYDATAKAEPPRRVVDSSASIGQEVRTTVGNPALRVKDYWVSRKTENAMQPSSGFTFTGGPNTEVIGADQQLKVLGNTALDGKKFTVLECPGSSIKLLVETTTGKLYDKVLNGEGSGRLNGPLVMIWTFKSIPENITFSNSTLETITKNMAYVNYEFIYSGKNGNSVSFLYREYSADDLARPAFFQSISYDLTEKTIEFKSIKFEVIEATSSFIRIKLLAL